MGFLSYFVRMSLKDIFQKAVFWFRRVCVNDLFAFAIEEGLQKPVYFQYIL